MISVTVNWLPKFNLVGAHSTEHEDSQPEENNSAQVAMSTEINAEKVEDSTTVDHTQPTSVDEAQSEMENSLENENSRDGTPVDDNKETIEADEQMEKSERDEKYYDEVAEANDKESEKNKSDFESESRQNEIVDQTPPLSPYKAADDGDGLQIEIAIEEVTQVVEIVVEEYPGAEKEITENSKQEIEIEPEETAEAPKPVSLQQEEKEPTEEEKTEISAGIVAFLKIQMTFHCKALIPSCLAFQNSDTDIEMQLQFVR